MPQRAVHLLPGGDGVALDGGAVRGLLLLEHRDQPVGELRQVVQQDAGGPVQHAQRVGVDQRPHAWRP